MTTARTPVCRTSPPSSGASSASRAAPPQQPQLEHGIGSGIILTPDGYILTNNHVIDGTIKMNVTLDDRRVFPARLIGADKLNDLAVIKMRRQNLPTVAWGDSTQLNPGQTVLAFGSPSATSSSPSPRASSARSTAPIPTPTTRASPATSSRLTPPSTPATPAAARQRPRRAHRHQHLHHLRFRLLRRRGLRHPLGDRPRHGRRHHQDRRSPPRLPRHQHERRHARERPASSTCLTPPAPSSAPSRPTRPPATPASRTAMSSANSTAKRSSTAAPFQVRRLADRPRHRHRSRHPPRRQARNPQAHRRRVPQGNRNRLQRQQRRHQARQARPHRRKPLPRHPHPAPRPDEVKGVASTTSAPAAPPDEAGLTRGDLILEVNRKPLTGIDTFADLVKNNPAGKDVLLLIWSRGGTTYRVLHTDQSSDKGQRPYNLNQPQQPVILSERSESGSPRMGLRSWGDESKDPRLSLHLP